MRTTNEISKKIMEEGLHLAEGETARCTCPVCRATHEKSCKIRRTEKGLVYKCFRASCGAKGLINSKGNFTQRRNFPEKKLSNKYGGKTYLLSDHTRQFLGRKFYLEDSILNSFRETGEGDVMLPIRNELGQRYGWINRRWKGLYDKERNPKAINYYDNRDGTSLHFTFDISNPVTTVVAVEDYISAERIGKYVPCVSLLGTNLLGRDAVLLRELGVQSLVILLDSDANQASLKLRNKHELMFDEVKSVVRNQKELDPKDMLPEELEDLLRSINVYT